jgi:SNF2 family DNA or RNA helicase
MRIEFDGHKISILLNSTEIRSYQQSQLRYWGFNYLEDEDKYVVSGNDTSTLLLKLVNYFREEGFVLELSEQCSEYLLRNTANEEKLISIRHTSGRFKDGVYDKDQFNEFYYFVNKYIPRKLKDHQIKAAYHLYLCKHGANFSVPGSGKTSVVLTVYEKLRIEGKCNLLVVIGPPASFAPWKNEFNYTLRRDPNARILSGGNPEKRISEYYKAIGDRGELYLTTFQTLLNDEEYLISFLNSQNINAFVVVDEAHYIKQINGNWALSAINIAKYSTFRCVLTGTPMPKNYSDIFNLFDYLWHNPVLLSSETKIIIHNYEKSKNFTTARDLLSTVVSPLYYRVRKRDLGLLDPVFHAPILIPMNHHEGIIYRALTNRIRDYAQQEYLLNINLVTNLRRGRIMRLRQCCSYVKLMASTIENYDESIISDAVLASVITNYDELEKPAKLEALEILVDKIRITDKKVLIWSNFVGSIEMIRQHFRNKGIKCESIYGKTPIQTGNIEEEDSRESIRDRFVDLNSGIDILIANPAACAESISLHKTCFHAIYYDLSYNCAQYLQSLDRIHRIGGSETNIANYYFLEYVDSIDNDVRVNLEQKANRMYQMIDADFAIYSLDMFDEDDSELQAYKRLFEGA